MSPLEEQVMAHRYLYYVKAKPVLSDHAYDMLEREAVALAPTRSPVHQIGSSLAADYPDYIVKIAERISANETDHTAA